MHNVVPNAKAYIATLQSRLLRLGGRIECDCPVSELDVRNGRVSGVVARLKGRSTVFQATRGVVLAAGDYANSPQMIGQYKGSQFTAIEGINPYATGDGHRLAEQAGAALVNMAITYGPELRFIPPPRKPFTQLLPGSGPVARIMGRMLPLVPRLDHQPMVKRLLVTWQHPENALFEEGAVLVNKAASVSATSGRPRPARSPSPVNRASWPTFCWTSDWPNATAAGRNSFPPLRRSPTPTWRITSGFAPT